MKKLILILTLCVFNYNTFTESYVMKIENNTLKNSIVENINFTNGWSQSGINEETRTPYDSNGWSINDIHKDTQTIYDPEGYNKDGYNASGIDREGWNTSNCQYNGSDVFGEYGNDFYITETTTRWDYETDYKFSVRVNHAVLTEQQVRAAHNSNPLSDTYDDGTYTYYKGRFMRRIAYSNLESNIYEVCRTKN